MVSTRSANLAMNGKKNLTNVRKRRKEENRRMKDEDANLAAAEIKTELSSKELEMVSEPRSKRKKVRKKSADSKNKRPKVEVKLETHGSDLDESDCKADDEPRSKKKKLRKEPSGSKNKLSKTTEIKQEMHATDSEESDWEEVDVGPSSSHRHHHHHLTDGKPLEITIGRGPNVEEEEIKKAWQREMKRLRRENKEAMHQITLLVYLAHLKSVSRVCCSKFLTSLAMSIIPIGFMALKIPKLDKDLVQKFAKWFKSAFVLSPASDDAVEINCHVRLKECLETKCVRSVKDMALLFVLLTRSMGWSSRFVLCLSSSSFPYNNAATVDGNSGNSPALENKSEKNDSPKSAPVKKDYDDDEISNSASGKSTPAKRPVRSANKSMNSSAKLKNVDFWAEIYSELLECWIPVSCQDAKIDDPKSIEGNSSSPCLYALAVDNDNAIKDVTARYNSNFALKSTRRLRIQEIWWQETLDLPYFKSKRVSRDRLEDAQLKRHISTLPFPKTIMDFKHHPAYVLKRDLLKFEVIYPSDTEPVALFRNEPVFPRECVHSLHTKETWLKEARTVKPGEEPMKIVKGRPKKGAAKSEQGDRMIPVFGRWQTQPYKPPVAKNGIVPRNQYGNVDLFKECMLPKGTVHLTHPGLLNVAKKLDIDCAQAMIGWDFHGGSSHPVFDGVVVCKKFEKTLLDAWEQEQSIIAEREEEKKQKRVLKNWARLTRSLLLREKVQNKFAGVKSAEISDSSGKKHKGKVCEEKQEPDEGIATPSTVNTQPNWLKHCEQFTFTGH